jgi:hypothetical protein
VVWCVECDDECGAGRDECDVEGLVGAELLVVTDGVIGTADPATGVELDEQAARLSRPIAPTAHVRKTTATHSGCHATPMRIRGWVDGASHCMIGTSRLCAIATQPAVE